MAVRNNPIRDRGPMGLAAQQHDESQRERSNAELWADALKGAEQGLATVLAYLELGLAECPEVRIAKLQSLLTNVYDDYQETLDEVESTEA